MRGSVALGWCAKGVYQACVLRAWCQGCAGAVLW